MKPPPSHARERLSAWTALTCLAGILPVASVGAQDAPADFPTEMSATLPISPQADNLLKTAVDAIERADWKAAADTLQAVLLGRFDALVAVDSRHFESPQRRAVRLIASLPPEGLRAYRLLYGGQAAALLARARRDHDLTLLQRVVREYLLTEAGDDAADLLAAWLIDEGKPTRALAVLDNLLAVYPDPSVPRGMLLAKKAIAARQAGQIASAAEALQEFRNTAVNDARLVPIAAALEAHIQAGDPDDADSYSTGSHWAAPGWPALLGPGPRTGRMPEAVPTLVDWPLWQYVLPAESAESPARLRQQQATIRGYPVFYPVTDGRTLWVRSEQQVSALDLESMEEIWRSRKVVDSPAAAAAELDYGFTLTLQFQGGPAQRFEDRRGRVLRTMLDELSASLTVIDDLVLTIDRYGHSTYHPPEIRDSRGTARTSEATAGQEFGAGESAVAGQGSGATRLVALNAVTGREVWSRGRSGVPEDPLGSGMFAGPPVDAGDSLLVPYREGQDLYLVSLAKEDGRLRERLYLCARNQPEQAYFEAMHLTLVDEILHAMVGGGFLMAVETDPLQLRWASAYPTTRLGKDVEHMGPALSRLGGWLSCPPVLCGAVVVCAPTDADEFFGFDAGTGRMLWRRPRGQYRYILGADDDTVWLGGEALGAVEVKTGAARTRIETPDATGRGVLSGPNILVPTRRELLVVDTRTGQVRDRRPVPPGQPLGNLFSYAGAVFSTEPTRVRKFPDLQSNYSRVARKLSADPGDAGLSLRLAWIESMRRDPDAVLAALSGLDLGRAALDHQQRRQVRHLRTLAHLELADREGTGAPAAEQHLQLALENARTPEDLVRARLAAAEYSARAGRPVESYRRFVSVPGRAPWDRDATASHRNQPLIDCGDGLRRNLSEVVRERMGDLSGSLTEDQRRTLQAEYDAELSESMREGDLHTVARLAETGVLGGVGDRALLALAGLERDRRRYEQAESLYMRVVHGGTTGGETARALAELADMYLDGEQNLVAGADALLRKLTQDHADQEFSPHIAGLPRGTLTTAAEAAELLRSRLDRVALARREAALDMDSIRPPRHQSWRRPVEADTRLVWFDDTVPEASAEAAFLLLPDEVIRRHDLWDGEVAWPAALRLLERFDADFLAPQEQRTFLDRFNIPAGRAVPARAVAHGQTMILNSSVGLHAIGMLTGRTIWNKPLTPVDPDMAPASGQLISLENGLLACIMEPGRLQVLRPSDGTVLWERQGDPADYRGLRLREGLIYVIDESGDRVSCFNAPDGAAVADYDFTTADRRYHPGVVIVDGVVCGVQGESVVAFDAADGQELWRLEPPAEVCSIFRPGRDLIGVGTDRGHCFIVEPASGRRLLEVRLPRFSAGVYEGSIDGEVLCLVGHRVNERGGRGLVLEGILLADGGEVWTAEDLPGGIDLANVVVTPRIIAHLPHWVPLYEYPGGFKRGGRRLAGRNPRVRLTFIEKKTGLPAGRPIEFEADSTQRFIPDLLVRSNQVLILTDHYLHSFGLPANIVRQARGNDPAYPLTLTWAGEP